MTQSESGKITARSTVSAVEGLATCELDGESVVLSLTSGTYFGLNEVGARVWQLLAQPRTIDAICGVIAAEYEVELAQCLADVLALIEQLSSAGLVAVEHERAA